MHERQVTVVLAAISVAASAFVSVRSVAAEGLQFAAAVQASPEVKLNQQLEQFEHFLAEMQRELAIPGMSAAIVKNHRVVWAQGFGYADVERKRPALPDTPYEIASLTKPLSSSMLLRLVEQGRVKVEDPVSKYGIHIKSPGVIRVKHLLGHTSQGDPGSVFRYSGARYGYLQKVIERGSGQPLPALFINTLLKPLGMSDSVPIEMAVQPQYAQVKNRLSKPYGMDHSYMKGLSAAAGLVSTVLDLAKFDIALDQDQVIRPNTKALAFTAQKLSSGDSPVYGLGWFVQEFQGTKMVYHFGYDSFSHLYLKFIDQGYTLIIFSNSTTFGEFLSAREWNVMRCPAALAFYKLFIRDMELGDKVNWDADKDVVAAQLQAAEKAGYHEIAKQEILNRYLTSRILKRTPSAQKALDTHAHFYLTNEPPRLAAQAPFAKIDRLGNNQYSIIEFTLKRDTHIDIYAVGEYFIGKMVDYGGIEDLSSRKLVWSMTRERTVPAGGGAMNRQAAGRVDLRSGTYRLHYRTDWGHSFDNWDALPPDDLFWGIALYSGGQDPIVATRTILPARKDQLLAPLMTPVISSVDYGMLWICIGVLLSVAVTMPVLLLRKKSRGGTTGRAWRWAKFSGWVAWVNSLLCPVQIFVLMMMVSLEEVVEQPIVLISSSGIDERTFVLSSYVCIALAIAQVIVALLAWAGRQRSLGERLYYSLATAAASGYLLLLSSWGLITSL
jgi:CubicO group peptidase (beta-lactamase class C family)